MTLRKKKSLVDRLESRFHKYAIRNLGKYIIMLYGIGTIIALIRPALYYELLSFDIFSIAKGQVWRIVTFLMQPPMDVSGFNIILTVISLSFYYWVFINLERTLGTFRVNLYYFAGLFFNVLTSIIFQLISGLPVGVELYYLNESLFLAFALLYPDVEVLFMMFLPVKVKWLGIGWGVFMLYDFSKMLIYLGRIVSEFGIASEAFKLTGIAVLFSIIVFIVSILNFIIFFFMLRKKSRALRVHRKAGRQFSQSVNKALSGSRHRCAICGRTENDDDSLEFRYCSKCKGNKEYCNVHLFTHTHV